MKTRVKKIEKVKLIDTKIFNDNRGFFYESFNRKRYKNLINVSFVQDNLSFSKKNVIRGLHYRYKPQAQLVTLFYGKIFDVIVDLRKNSKTYKKWMGINLDFKKNNQLYMPPGVAHGFCVMSDYAIVHYKVSKYYEKDNEAGILWNDEMLNIKWPVKNPIISAKDKKHPYFKNIKS